MSQRLVSTRATVSPPTVLAYRIGDQFWVWCSFEQCWHYHGAAGGNGHRRAHCSDPDSPYITSGYVIQEAVGRVLWVLA